MLSSVVITRDSSLRSTPHGTESCGIGEEKFLKNGLPRSRSILNLQQSAEQVGQTGSLAGKVKR